MNVFVYFIFIRFTALQNIYINPKIHKTVHLVLKIQLDGTVSCRFWSAIFPRPSSSPDTAPDLRPEQAGVGLGPRHDRCILLGPSEEVRDNLLDQSIRDIPESGKISECVSNIYFSISNWEFWNVSYFWHLSSNPLISGVSFVSQCESNMIGHSQQLAKIHRAAPRP